MRPNLRTVVHHMLVVISVVFLAVMLLVVVGCSTNKGVLTKKSGCLVLIKGEVTEVLVDCGTRVKNDADKANVGIGAGTNN